MQTLAIILLCVAASILYGICHDQITARICVEYFTIGHPTIIDSESPTVLALVWGVVATWWVGAIGGGLLALSARAGHKPKITVSQLVRPILWLLLVMAIASTTAGLIGHQLAVSGKVWRTDPLASMVPPWQHVPFLTDAFAHNAAYLVGFAGMIVLAVRTWRRRSRAAAAASAVL